MEPSMSAQTCSSSSVPFVPPAVASVDAAPAAVRSPLAVAKPSVPGLWAWARSVWRQHRNKARLRSLGAELDEHMLKDVGAPNWLVNEVSVRRELTRLRDVNYLRW